MLIPLPVDESDVVPLVRWAFGRLARLTRWHAESSASRWQTACGLKVVEGKVRRRLAFPGNWPDMCEGCKLKIIKGDR